MALKGPARKESEVELGSLQTEQVRDSNAEVQLVHFGWSMTSNEVIRELDKSDLRPVEMSELINLGKNHPHFHGGFPIVTLGSRRRVLGNYWDVPFFDEGGVKWRRGLNWTGDMWSDICRFAAVKK